MQKFSEFVDAYKAHRQETGKSTELNPKQVAKLRSLYESMVSKKSEPAKKVEESVESFDVVLEKYREWKQANRGTRGVTNKEKENLKEAIARKAAGKKLKESAEKCPSCGNDVEKVTKVEDYLKEKDIQSVTAEEIIEALNKNGYVDDLTPDTEICEDCIDTGIDLVLDAKEEGKEPSEEETAEAEKEAEEFEFEESIESFGKVVTAYREWKQTKYNTSRLTENEKEVLKAKFLEAVSKKKETVGNTSNPRLDEAIKQYKEWKKKEHGTEEISKFEEATIAKNLVLDDIKSKINEAQKFVESGKKHLKEGDVMDAGADVQAAGAAINDAAAAGADPALAGDPNAAAPLPQNIVDEISNIKTSIDSLATEVGIESPVDLGADANAGVPAVTGAADATADATAPVDPNAAPAPEAAPAADPNAAPAPLPESMKSIKQRIAEREAKLAETIKISNVELKDGAKDSLVKIPSEEVLVKGNGNISANVKKAEWPVKNIKVKDATKVKSLEESQEELAKKTLDESGEFSWKAYTEMLKNL